MIHLVTALPAEAKPLIRHFHLKLASQTGPFRVYEGRDLELILSGPGKLKAAAATAYLGARSEGSTGHVWMNVGIGGHKSARIGQSFLATKITDAATRLNWYPPLVFDVSCARARVLTVDRVEWTYQEDAVYEMEASGFYETAMCFSPGELVHVFKIVSDHLAQGPHHVTAKRVETIVEKNIPTIQSILNQADVLAQGLRTASALPALFHQILEQWHFTVTETHQLRRLAMRVKVLQPETLLSIHEIPKFQKAKDVLGFLRHKLESVPFYIVPVNRG